MTDIASGSEQVAAELTRELTELRPVQVYELLRVL
jgi:hypothetical protein